MGVIITINPTSCIYFVVPVRQTTPTRHHGAVEMQLITTRGFLGILPSSRLVSYTVLIA